MTCKECIHQEVCGEYNYYYKDIDFAQNCKNYRKEIKMKDTYIADSPDEIYISPLGDEGLIILPHSRYEKLLEDSLLLGYLREYGVDNWSGYDNAIAALNGEVKE